MKGKISLSVVYVVLVVLLLGGGFLAGRHFASPDIALAQDDTLGFSPDIPGAPELASFGCTSINNVAAFDNRIHLRCSVPNGGILYYAYVNDPGHFSTANQFLAIGNTAFALGKGVVLFYNSDPALNPPGCIASDCRGLYGVSMVQ